MWLTINQGEACPMGNRGKGVGLPVRPASPPPGIVQSIAGTQDTCRLTPYVNMAALCMPCPQVSPAPYDITFHQASAHPQCPAGVTVALSLHAGFLVAPMTSIPVAHHHTTYFCMTTLPVLLEVATLYNPASNTPGALPLAMTSLPVPHDVTPVFHRHSLCCMTTLLIQIMSLPVSQYRSPTPGTIFSPATCHFLSSDLTSCPVSRCHFIYMTLLPVDQRHFLSLAGTGSAACRRRGPRTCPRPPVQRARLPHAPGPALTANGDAPRGGVGGGRAELEH